MFAIPSYNRFETLKEKSLKFLTSNGVSLTDIYVFVVEEEYDLYNTLGCNVIKGEKGLKNQRNFIINYFDEGTSLICLDDDIESIDGLENPFLDFVNNTFELMKKEKCYLSGIYPCFNKFFRKNTITTDLRFIIGCFYFVFNRKDMIEQDNFNNKDDYSRTIRHFIKDGCVLRYNNIAVKTKFYSKGGLGNFKDRLESSKIECELFKKKYDEYCRLKIRKNGMSEIVLKKNITLKNVPDS